MQNDQECRLTLEEAIQTAHSYQLRDLFATFLIHGTVSDAEGLWHEFGWPLAANPGEVRPQPRPGGFLDDYIRKIKTRLGLNPHEALGDHLLEEAEHSALHQLAEELEPSHKTLEDFGITPPPNPNRWDLPILEERDRWSVANHPELSVDSIARRVMLLNPEQRQIYDIIINSVREDIEAGKDTSGASGKSRAFFLDAPGGCGKTFLLELIIDTVRSWDNIVTATASSGVAALLLPGGMTAHSKYDLPLDVREKVVCNVSFIHIDHIIYFLLNINVIFISG